MNILGNIVGEQRNKGQYLSEVMDENHIHIQNTNWLVKDQIVNGNLWQKTAGLLSLPGLALENTEVGVKNIIYGARGLVNSAVETVVTPFGDLLYDAWMWGAVKLAVKEPDANHKVTKQEKHANGTTTLHVNTVQDYYDKQKAQHWEYDKFGGRVEKPLKLNITNQDMEAINSGKPLYDARNKLQKELNALKKEHEKGWIFTKPWTDEEISKAKWLAGNIQTYNEAIESHEQFYKNFPPKKVSVETPRKKH
jgi:hypothetical protein